MQTGDKLLSVLAAAFVVLAFVVRMIAPRTTWFVAWVAATATYCLGHDHAAKQPFTVRISIENSTVKAGSPVTLDISLKNTSTQDLTLNGGFDASVPGVDTGNWFEVRDSLGKLIPRRERNSKIPLDMTPLFHTLGPGESFTEHEDINQLYDLSRPDKYVIRVSRVIPKELGKGTVKSNEITVTVTP
jgi:hypothetical protein